jgi:hypothetical protein
MFKIEDGSSTDATETPPLSMADLTQTEQAVASLGVDPNALKPISWMNEAHYNTLLRANAVDGDLARKLEAYKMVAAGNA